MGQKVNPNIYKLNSVDSWSSKYIEKKSKDFYLCTTKDIEVKKFIIKFFKKKGLNVHECKINYLNKNLNIFITYHQNTNSISIIKQINKGQKIKLMKKFFSKRKKKYNFPVFKTSYFDDDKTKARKNLLKKKKIARKLIKKKIKKYFNYENINYKKNLLNKNKFSIRLLKRKRIKMIKYYKKYFNLNLNKNLNNLKINNFFNSFFESINLFYNKLFQINLVLQPLNNNVNRRFNNKKKVRASLKNYLIGLNQYQKNESFKEGVNIMFSCMTHRNSAYLLSEYISTSLKKLKKHNFFLKFVKATLTKLRKILPLLVQGIKIKIKGRINRRPRARHRIINIGKTPVMTLSSFVDYSETTAYTPNGTLGIKVWIGERNLRIQNKKKI